jgi:hypothetical protein
VDEYVLILGVSRMPDDGIAARVEERLVAIVPPNPIVLVLGASENLQNLARTSRLGEPVSVDHDQVTNFCTV